MQETAPIRRCGYIALAGRPNAGKSTFLNRAIGQKVAIVSDKPQTTRHRILGIYHDRDLQIGFLDLPGVHKPNFKMNREMMRAVYSGLKDADLIFHFIDLTAPLGSGDQFVHDRVGQVGVPVILVANKVDLINKAKLIGNLDALQKRFEPAELVPLSAASGDNIERLIEVARGYLPESEFLFPDDDLTDQPMRLLASEFIREKVLYMTRDELPHVVAVSIDEYAYDEELDEQFIAARIWVERATQRKIILGKGGSLIRKIRHAAQRALKELIGHKVTLELYVKVEKDWRNDRDQVRDALQVRDPLQ